MLFKTLLFEMSSICIEEHDIYRVFNTGHCDMFISLIFPCAVSCSSLGQLSLISEVWYMLFGLATQQENVFKLGKDRVVFICHLNSNIRDILVLLKDLCLQKI